MESDTSYPVDVRVASYAEARGLAPDPGTRTYREQGRVGWLSDWNRRISRHFSGELIPFEWVPDYVGVARSAVQKRVKKGQLTLFVFEMEEHIPKLLGGTRSRMRREYRLVPSTECDIWILTRCRPLERSDLRELRTPHVPGWWNDVDLDGPIDPKYLGRPEA